VEAFPNAFLGVLMPEDEMLSAPKFKRGRRFDWLYDQMVTTGRLESLLSRNLDLPDVIWASLRSEANHEKRAALICLLTAALADKGTATIIGETVKRRADGSGSRRGRYGKLGRRKVLRVLKKGGIKGDFRSGPTTLNAFGVSKNRRQAVWKIILTQRIEDFQNTACGDGLP
jgi:hypothetical protein